LTGLLTTLKCPLESEGQEFIIDSVCILVTVLTCININLVYKTREHMYTRARTHTKAEVYLLTSSI